MPLHRKRGPCSTTFGSWQCWCGMHLSILITYSFLIYMCILTKLESYWQQSSSCRSQRKKKCPWRSCKNKSGIQWKLHLLKALPKNWGFNWELTSISVNFLGWNLYPQQLKLCAYTDSFWEGPSDLWSLWKIIIYLRYKILALYFGY